MIVLGRLTSLIDFEETENDYKDMSDYSASFKQQRKLIQQLSYSLTYY
jgi:hypothetical protein